jgi:hypothetical protein
MPPVSRPEGERKARGATLDPCRRRTDRDVAVVVGENWRPTRSTLTFRTRRHKGSCGTSIDHAKTKDDDDDDAEAEAEAEDDAGEP